MKIERVTRLYERILTIGAALLPALGIWYLATFSASPALRFEDHRFHEIAIVIATVIGGFISYVSWRSYRESGEIFLRWLTAGFLSSTVIYSLHGVLTRTAGHNIWLFILYGPVSRFAMLGCFVAAVAHYGKPPEDPLAVASRGFWWRVVGLCFVANVAVAILAYSPIASSVWVRMLLESVSIFLCAIALVIGAKRRIQSPLMKFYAIALVIFAHAAFAFILAKPWNHMWWLAHAIFAGGFFVLSWGVTRALATTRSFSLAYSQEHLEADREAMRNKLQATLDALPDLLFELDAEGRILSYHSHRSELLAAPPEVFMGKRVADVLPKEAASAVQRALNEAAQSGLSSGVTYRLALPQGEHWFELSVAPMPSDVKTTQRFVVISRDITERMQAGIELRDERKRLRTILDTVDNPIFVKDNQHRIVLANRAFDRIFGLPSGAAIGKSLAEHVSEGERRHFLAIDRQVLDTGKPDEREESLTVNGVTRVIITKKARFVEESGEPFLVGAIHDITEHRLAEAKIIEAKDRAESANRAKSAFLSSMSHELRTPLNAILGFAQLMSLDPHLSDEQEEFIAQIIDSGKILLSLVEDVLNLSRMESGGLSLDLKPVSVRSIVQSCFAMVRHLADPVGIQLIEGGGDGLDAIIFADPIRLQQVVLNLLTNAIKYNRPQGSVRLTAALTGKGTVRIRVTDTGHGIAADKQQRLFVAFDRLGHENGTIRGTGIGLVTTRRIVESMGGTIGFDSVVGKGSTFWAEFPVVGADGMVAKSLGAPAPSLAAPVATESLRSAAWAAPLPSPVAEKAPLAAATGRARILLIDDEPTNLKLLQQFLMDDYDLTLADSGAAGLEHAAKSPPDLILIDVMMPGMDGYETCRRLKADPRLATIPVVFVTAQAATDDELAGLALGAADYITKPFQLVIVRRRIGNLLEREPLRKDIVADRDQLEERVRLLTSPKR